MSEQYRRMDLDAAAVELYGLLPEQFTARRSELVAQARKQGDAEARVAIAAMRRPTVAAWVVNLLVRRNGAGVEDFLRIAGELRAAQRDLNGPRLREIAQRRRAASATLVIAARAAAVEAGRAVNDDVLREVQASLDAAVADENAEVALRGGRLTTALRYSGFDEVDVSEAVAASSARPRLSVVRTDDVAAEDQGAGALKRSQPGGTAEDRHLAGAQQASATNERRVEAARARLEEVSARRDALLADAEQLRRRINDVERELRPTEAEVRSARRSLETAQRASSLAAERLSRSRRPN